MDGIFRRWNMSRTVFEMVGNVEYRLRPILTGEANALGMV